MKNISWFNHPSVKNYGDDLNPWLYEKITGVAPNYVPFNQVVPKYIAIGSVISSATPSSIVWGAGVMFPNDRIRSGVDIRAVRGKLSKKAADISGVKCPEVFGDPALLMPKFYNPKIDKKYKLGIIPHYVDKQHVRLPEGADDVLVLDIGCGIEAFVDQLLSCEKIVTSTLHGLITADAYGIDARWAEFSDNVAGKGYKFKDYFSSIGMNPYKAINLRGAPMLSPTALINAVESYEIDIDLDKLMKACPFI